MRLVSLDHALLIPGADPLSDAPDNVLVDENGDPLLDENGEYLTDGS